MLRYKLRTLLIVLALGPPLIAVAWWYGQRIPAWVIALAVCAMIPHLLMGAFGYGFGVLCHLIARLPGGHDDRDSD